MEKGLLCSKPLRASNMAWLRGLDLNQRPPGYEPDELPGCSTPRIHITRLAFLLQPQPRQLPDTCRRCVRARRPQSRWESEYF
jgi:hypothetical protein